MYLQYEIYQISSWNMILIILMIFGIKEKSIIFGYCYKYTCATYDWFCVPYIYTHFYFGCV